MRRPGAFVGPFAIIRFSRPYKTIRLKCITFVVRIALHRTICIRSPAVFLLMWRSLCAFAPHRVSTIDFQTPPPFSISSTHWHYVSTIMYVTPSVGYRRNAFNFYKFLKIFRIKSNTCVTERATTRYYDEPTAITTQTTPVSRTLGWKYNTDIYERTYRPKPSLVRDWWVSVFNKSVERIYENKTWNFKKISSEIKRFLIFKNHTR